MTDAEINLNNPEGWWCITAVLAIIAVFAMANMGCVVVYAPKADRASLYSHDQVAERMTINQDVDPRVVDSIKGVVGADLSGAGAGAGSGSANKTIVEKDTKR